MKLKNTRKFMSVKVTYVKFDYEKDGKKLSTEYGKMTILPAEEVHRWFIYSYFLKLLKNDFFFFFFLMEKLLIGF